MPVGMARDPPMIPTMDALIALATNFLLPWTVAVIGFGIPAGLAAIAFVLQQISERQTS